MTTAATLAAEPMGFSHEAFLYSSPGEFLRGTSAFVREGLERGEAILVAVAGERERWLREHFGDQPDLAIVDMARLGVNPARIIPAWRRFLDENMTRGRGVRGIGEPIWAGRSTAEIAECQQHESLLNLAFGGGPSWRLLCPYDVLGLPLSVLSTARANHPCIVTDTARSESPTYDPEAPRRALRGQPLPPPSESPIELAFAAAELASVRQLVGQRCESVGLPTASAADLVLCVNEVASNSLLHGSGQGILRMWAETDTLVCEVSDDGVIANPLVGRAHPPLERTGGRGLWLANQLCDLVQVRSDAGGTVVRLHVRLQ